MIEGVIIVTRYPIRDGDDSDIYQEMVTIVICTSKYQVYVNTNRS